MEDYSGYLSTKEAARALRISESMIKKLHGSGRLPGRLVTVLGKKEILLFLREDVEALKSRDTKRGPKPKKPDGAESVETKKADKKKSGPKKKVMDSD